MLAGFGTAGAPVYLIVATTWFPSGVKSPAWNSYSTILEIQPVRRGLTAAEQAPSASDGATGGRESSKISTGSGRGGIGILLAKDTTAAAAVEASASVRTINCIFARMNGLVFGEDLDGSDRIECAGSATECCCCDSLKQSSTASIYTISSRQHLVSSSTTSTQIKWYAKIEDCSWYRNEGSPDISRREPFFVFFLLAIRCTVDCNVFSLNCKSLAISQVRYKDPRRRTPDLASNEVVDAFYEITSSK